MSKKLFIDFDETLFYHYDYMKWVDSFLARQGLIQNPGEYNRLVEHFREPKGENLRLYDHDGHMREATGKNWSLISGELEKAMQQEYCDFCYQDAHPFLEKATRSNWDVRILTYGNVEYQRHKIKTCRVLTDLRIPVHVVNEPKREFLEREFAGEEGVLVDDKHPLRLPRGWRHVWINRLELVVQPAPFGEEVERITSLQDFRL